MGQWPSKNWPEGWKTRLWNREIPTHKPIEILDLKPPGGSKPEPLKPQPLMNYDLEGPPYKEDTLESYS